MYSLLLAMPSRFGTSVVVIKNEVRPEGFEPPTYALKAHSSDRTELRTRVHIAAGYHSRSRISLAMLTDNRAPCLGTTPALLALSVAAGHGIPDAERHQRKEYQPQDVDHCLSIRSCRRSDAGRNARSPHRQADLTGRQ